MKQKLPLFLIGSCIFLLFVFFSYLVDKNVFKHFDFNTTVRLQDHISRRFDPTFSFFSDIGSFEIVTIFLLLFLLVRNDLDGWIHKGIALISTLFFFGVFHLFEIYGKVFVDQSPPPEFLLRTKKIIEFPQFHIRQEFSYPSGHAGRATFVSVLLIIFILRFKKLSSMQKGILIGIVCMYDIVMFVSRVYLGEHWASDIIGGILLGGSLGVVSSLLFWNKNEVPQASRK